MPSRSLAIAIMMFGAVCSGQAKADVKPAAIFGDHMVLQSGMAVPVWGKAEPGEAVTVSLGNQKQSATTGADGKWQVRLGNLQAAQEPVELTIAGKNTMTIKDVLIGEVWVGSGQSNMEFSVSKDLTKYPGMAKRYAGVVNEEQEIAAANYPKIRMFTPRSVKSYEPAADVQGEWKICSPETVPGFSAIGYFFARDLQKELNVPVGIVTVAFGASCAEAWISRETMSSDPLLKKYLDGFDVAVRFYREKPSAPGSEAPKRVRTMNNRGSAAAPARQSDPVQDQHYPTVMYNGMVAPIIPFAMRGVLWYQGESIIGGTQGVNEYGKVQQALVKDWRKQWNRADLPFYIVQLPGQENISNSPRIREEQATVLALPNTGMAVTIDLGEARDVHPHNKVPVCNRLVKIALANVYGKSVEFSGPMFEAMRVTGSQAKITFQHAAGLRAKEGEIKGFEIAGADQKFVAAKAAVEGEGIVVSSAEVPQPVAVRYAWSNYPEGMGCNLYNAAGLPAAPFRTDKFDYPIEGITESPIGPAWFGEKPAGY